MVIVRVFIVQVERSCWIYYNNLYRKYVYSGICNFIFLNIIQIKVLLGSGRKYLLIVGVFQKCFGIDISQVYLVIFLY